MRMVWTAALAVSAMLVGPPLFASPALAQGVTPAGCRWIDVGRDEQHLYCRDSQERMVDTGQSHSTRATAESTACPRGRVFDGAECVPDASQAPPPAPRPAALTPRPAPRPQAAPKLQPVAKPQPQATPKVQPPAKPQAKPAAPPPKPAVVAKAAPPPPKPVAPAPPPKPAAVAKAPAPPAPPKQIVRARLAKLSKEWSATKPVGHAYWNGDLAPTDPVARRNLDLRCVNVTGLYDTLQKGDDKTYKPTSLHQDSMTLAALDGVDTRTAGDAKLYNAVKRAYIDSLTVIAKVDEANADAINKLNLMQCFEYIQYREPDLAPFHRDKK